MQLAHLAVIDPAVRIPELDCFNELGKRANRYLSYHLPALYGMDSLYSIQSSITSILILGSSSSVHDRAPWQVALEKWLMPQLEQKKPTLGLCYGHQMLAYMLGGKVDFVLPDRSKFQKFRKIAFKPNRLWGEKGLEGEIWVSHREAVVECPKSMQIVASSDEIAIEGLAHVSLPIWSLQSHPEATGVFLKNLGSAQQVDPKRFEFGQQILNSFLKLS